MRNAFAFTMGNIGTMQIWDVGNWNIFSSGTGDKKFWHFYSP